MNTIESKYPTITVSCDTREKNVTHARLIMYPRSLFIQYGSFKAESFDTSRCEVLPIVLHPELDALYDGERWVLEEVHQMFDMTDEPELAEVG